MIKLVALFKFKPGLSREAGIEYYENRHVPMILDIFPGYFIDYRRNYFDQDLVTPDHVTTVPPPPAADMMTELWFERKERYDEMIAMMGDPAIGNRVAADEANFLDRDSLVMFLVDERRTPKAALAGG